MKKVIILLLIILCTGCGKTYTPITFEEFRDKCDEKELYFYDVSESFKENENVIQAGMAATATWHIEFYVFLEEDNAKDAFDANKQDFLEIKKESSTFVDEEENDNNRETYSLTTNKTYYYVSRIDDTMIFVKVPVEYRGRVKKLHKELGY